jgi:protein required for attachment to host cells
MKWIAVVNRVEARIYNAANMRRMRTLSNVLGREKNRAFTTDKPGSDRNRVKAKSSIHGLTGEKRPHDDIAKQFAHRVNELLSKDFNQHRFSELLVVAEPRMMGWLKSAMDKNLKGIAEWKSKDLGKVSDHALKVLMLGKEKVWPRPASHA